MPTEFTNPAMVPPVVPGVLSAQQASDLLAHEASQQNPHGVTAAQVGLGSVDNTPDVQKPLSAAQAAAIATALANAVSRGNHTGTQSMETVEGLSGALLARVGVAVGMTPGELSPEFQAQHLLVVKDGWVWLHSPLWPSDPILLKEGAPTSNPIAWTLNVTCIEDVNAGQGRRVEYSDSMPNIPPGSYLVTISAASFNCPAWGSHSLWLEPGLGSPVFSGELPGSLYGLAPDQSGQWVSILLDDPWQAPNPQVGTIQCVVTEETTFALTGYLPAIGDTVEITFTFTPI